MGSVAPRRRVRTAPSRRARSPGASGFPVWAKGCAPEGVLIAEQVADGIELVLGANRDPEVGPVILFGTGGVELELYRDVALAPPPLDEARALALIEATRAGKLVHGYRGRPALDVKAAVAALIGLSRLLMDAGGRIH